jgi:hypothetical protein
MLLFNRFEGGVEMVRQALIHFRYDEVDALRLVASLKDLGVALSGH